MALPQRKENDRSQQQASFRQAANDSNYAQNGRMAANDAVYNVRRVSTDRADLHPDIKNRGNTRNVRTSRMPGKGLAGDFSSHLTTDKQFNAEYAKKGLQPSSLEDRTSRRSYEQTEQITRSEEAQIRQEEEIQEQQMIENQSLAEQHAIEEQEASVPQTPPPDALRTQNKKATLKIKRRVARLKARGLNKAIFSAGIFVWSIFQVPFALLLTIVFLAAMAIDGIVAAVTTATPDDGFFTLIGKKIASTAVDALGGLASYANDLIGEIFGVDLSGVIEGFFGILYALMIGYGVFVLLLIYIVYKIALLSPLSGEKAGLKIGMFILAIVGYAIPILNLIPWFIPWTWAVGKYPK